MSEIIHVKTQSGFEADINSDALDDMELLEDLSRMDACSRHYLHLACVIHIADQRKAVLIHLQISRASVRDMPRRSGTSTVVIFGSRKPLTSNA